MDDKLHDWRDDFTDEEKEVADYLMGNYICNYCRKSVNPDIGQTEIYCPHCQMITEAVPAEKPAV